MKGVLIRLAAVGLATVVAACSGERPSDRSPSEQQVRLSVPSPCASPTASAGELSTGVLWRSAARRGLGRGSTATP